jgi:hypothetical protein
MQKQFLLLHLLLLFIFIRPIKTTYPITLVILCVHNIHSTLPAGESLNVTLRYFSSPTGSNGGFYLPLSGCIILSLSFIKNPFTIRHVF